ncbi:MAG: hypothetical protein ACI83H_000989 [Glaciecola sp.]|jgi:hypothetical protein
MLFELFESLRIIFSRLLISSLFLFCSGLNELLKALLLLLELLDVFPVDFTPSFFCVLFNKVSASASPSVLVSVSLSVETNDEFAMESFGDFNNSFAFYSKLKSMVFLSTLFPFTVSVSNCSFFIDE